MSVNFDLTSRNVSSAAAFNSLSWIEGEGHYKRDSMVDVWMKDGTTENSYIIICIAS